MKVATKIVFLLCLVMLVCVPIVRWCFDPSIDLAPVGTFALGVGVPMGVLTGSMVAGKIVKKNNETPS